LVLLAILSECLSFGEEVAGWVFTVITFQITEVFGLSITEEI
jgi:hypothetical protein